MKISVCLCTYNGARYIEEQLNSIINQTLTIDEIIVSDDNSSDNTIEIVENILKNSNIEHVINVNKPNLGVTKNFEKACSMASGDVVFFSDQDDIWMQNKVEEHINGYEKHPDAQLVFTDAELFDDNGSQKRSCLQAFGFEKKKKRVFGKSQLRAILIGWYVTGATMSARKTFVDTCMPFNKGLLHDQILSFCAACDNQLLLIDKKLIRYRQHKEQVVGTQDLSLSQSAKLKVKYDVEYAKLDILESLATDEQCMQLLVDKRAWLLKREDIQSSSCLPRLCKAIINLLTGNYSKFSNNALLSCAKDILRR